MEKIKSVGWWVGGLVGWWVGIIAHQHRNSLTHQLTNLPSSFATQKGVLFKMSKISKRVNKIVHGWPFSRLVKPPLKKEPRLFGIFQFRKKPKKRNLSQQIQGGWQKISKWRK